MKRLAMIFGVLYLIAGIAGFVPALCPDGKLFGLFAVDAMHNVVHIASGVAAIAMASAGELWARNFFRIFGVVYGLVTLMGFFASRDGMVLGMAMNMADNFLHLAISAVSLYLGFFWHREPLHRDLRGA